MKPGFHSIEASSYHSGSFDPTTPYLSQSLIKVLMNEAPDHARERHPLVRQFKDYEWPTTDAQKLGNVCHSMILGESHRYKVFNPADYPTSDGKPGKTLNTATAQRALEEWRATGGLDISEKTYRNASACVGMATAAIMEDYPAWADGQSEVCVLWDYRLNDQTKIRMKARLDRLVNRCVCVQSQEPHAHIFDPKFSQRKFSDRYIDNTAEADGWAIQHSMYVDGVTAHNDIPALFTFVAIELYPPYAVRFVTLDDGQWLKPARAEIDRAANIWGTCLKSGVWPGRTKHYQAMRPEWASANELDALMASLEEEA